MSALADRIPAGPDLWRDRPPRCGAWRSRVGICLGAAVLASIALAGAARASAASEQFGIEGFGNAIGGTQAGSHPDSMTTTIVFNHRFDLAYKEAHNGDGELPYGSPKTIELNLPAGVVVDPRATEARCTEAELENQGDCPGPSAVGVVTVVSEFLEDAEAPIFNMVPPPGVPGELGVNIGSLGIVAHIVGKVRAHEYGLSADISDITQQTDPFVFEATIWGDPSSASHDAERGYCVEKAFAGPCPAPVERTGRPFLTLPSSCSGEPLTATVSATSWQEPNAPPVQASATSPAVTGCEKLAFSPRISAQPDTSTADSPSGLDFDLQIPQEEESTEGLAEASLRTAVVSFPTGMAVSPSAAGGLGACTPAQIDLEDASAPSCPPSSKVGSVEAITPLLESPLHGALYLAQPRCGGAGQPACTEASAANGELVGVYLVLEGSGVVVKVPGRVSLDPVTGQVTSTFQENPQLPFSELKVKLFGGPRASLATPPGCGTYTTTTQMTPWSAPFSGPPATPQDSFAISSGCGGGFAPSFTAGTEDSRANAFSAFTMTLARNDGEQRLAGVQLTLPPGLLAVLKSVAQCPEPQATDGTCGPESLIGGATVAAGPGPDPFWASGEVYLTGPYNGAPFGLSIVVPAVAGPFNLGNVVERAAITIDPQTAQVTVTSTPLRRILMGIPLDLRTVNVTVDRPGFTFNPTSCAAQTVGGTIASTGGASAVVSNRFQATSCGLLAFKPKFTASTQARTSKANGASLDVKVSLGAGQAHIAKTTVTLPRQLPARLTTLQQACLAPVFDRNPASCPAASVVGVATALTPLLAHRLTGPAYLVSHGGGAFPDLVIVLQGEGVTVDLVGQTRIRKGITSNTFNSLPDAPVSAFELKLPEGPHSVFAANGRFCAQTLRMPTTITGQNGVHVKQATRIAVEGCPKIRNSKNK
jgi:hypothetical protein